MARWERCVIHILSSVGEKVMEAVIMAYIERERKRYVISREKIIYS